MIEILKLIESLASQIQASGDIQSCIQLVENLIQLHCNVKSTIPAASAAPVVSAANDAAPAAQIAKD